MARPLPPDSPSLTGAGAGLVTDASGAIDPDAVAGLFVDDVRVVSRRQLTADGLDTRLAGRQRTGPSSDRLVFTLSVAGSVDPIATLQSDRVVTGRGVVETMRITAYTNPLSTALRLAIERDDLPVYDVGTEGTKPGAAPTAVVGTAGQFELPGPIDGPDVSVVAPGWPLEDDVMVIAVDLDAGATLETTIAVAAASEVRPDAAMASPSAVVVRTAPEGLQRLVESSRADLRALTIPIDDREVIAAGSPFFLGLFGRDSIITGVQALIDAPARLGDILTVLARTQATTTDEPTRARPGQILHELRVGRMRVHGVSPGTPYYGAIDTAALFVVALGEAMRWGAPLDDIAALVPAAKAALRWCRDYGDVDVDGFIESVPHPTGLTNLHWKDSDDSIVREDGSTVVGNVAVPEVQAYWYRALRSMAEIEQCLGLGDGAEDLDDAERLAGRFAEKFLFTGESGPFVGLALDEDKTLLAVRASNAGQVLWAGILPPKVAVPVAEQLLLPDLFSGWGLRTLSSSAAGYNPFGYHRGTVWPHDTALAAHGAARYGATGTLAGLAGGLTSLGLAGGELPELISGIARDDLSLPVSYAAACRPQAWAAGASLMVVRALLGLEPDVPAGVVRLHPSLPPDQTVELRDLRLGKHDFSVTARGDQVIDVDCDGLTVVTGPDGVLAATGWCPDPASRR